MLNWIGKQAARIVRKKFLRKIGSLICRAAAFENPKGLTR